MATLIQDITTTNWSLSPSAQGEVLLDADDILFCVHNCLFTRKGEVPLDPLWGSILNEYIDKPFNKVAPLVVAEIISVIGRCEPRVKVDKVTYAISSGGLVFTIMMTVIASSASVPYDLTLGNFGINASRAFTDAFSKSL